MAASPPVPVPPALRRLVRFAKLSDTALSTVRRVLDEDEQFRSYVCAALSMASLEDELDRPSALFLQRPQGWEEELAELTAGAAEATARDDAARAAATAARRLDVVQAARDRAEAQVARQKEELVALRSQLAEERRGRLTAQSDVGRLRKRVSELEDRTPAAAEDRAEARVAALAAELAAADQRAAAAEASAEAERARAASALQAAAACPPVEVPAAPLVDHRAVAEGVTAAVAAVASLAEALGRAAEGLAPLSPPPAAGVPGPPAPDGSERTGAARTARGPVRVPVPLPPAVFDDTVQAVEHLVRAPGVVVLVDGYNVTLSVRSELPLVDQRRWLLDAAGGLAARTGATVDVVFDGDRASSPADRQRRLGVQARFTAEGVEADDVLLDLVGGLPSARPVVVVSDDRRVRDGARRLGANVVGVDPFVDALRR